jgi:hypothetical protein
MTCRGSQETEEASTTRGQGPARDELQTAEVCGILSPTGTHFLPEGLNAGPINSSGSHWCRTGLAPTANDGDFILDSDDEEESNWLASEAQKPALSDWETGIGSGEWETEDWTEVRD